MRRFIDQTKARALVEDKKIRTKLKKKFLDLCIKFGYVELDWVDKTIDEYVEIVKGQINETNDVIKEKEVIKWKTKSNILRQRIGLA